MLHIITGGSGSGKSAYAEEKILSFGEAKRIYIATMYPFDEESHRRIARHRDMRREKKFETIECYKHLEEVSIPEDCCVLLECMSNLTANEMYQEGGAGKDTANQIVEAVCTLNQKVKEFVIVTNEIFSTTNFYEEETLEYQRILGEINTRLVSCADEAVEVVYGIPIVWKREDKNKNEALVE